MWRNRITLAGAHETFKTNVYAMFWITGGQTPEKIPSFGKEAPIGCAGQPAELAGAYVLLASAASSLATGQVYGAIGVHGSPVPEDPHGSQCVGGRLSIEGQRALRPA